MKTQESVKAEGISNEDNIVRGTLYIGIDCAPGTPRPDTYIAGALACFGLVAECEPSSKLFGAWRWFFKDVPESLYDANSAKVKAYLDALYERGAIRGAEWDFTPNTVKE